MFKINDGREHFYQWDLNRKLEVKDASIKEVHFCNRTDDCSLVVEVVDGVANVPNILLQDNFRINVYGYDGEATKHSATFAVKARSKPADYVYTETEVKSWEVYGERIAALEENGGGITELTEETFIADLITGIYAINYTDGAYALWLDDAYWLSLENGIAIITWIEELEVYEWIAIGRDSAWVNGIMRGTTTKNLDDDYWECLNYGEIESTTNKVNELSKPNTTTYPTTTAVANEFENYKLKYSNYSQRYDYDLAEYKGKTFSSLSYPMFEMSIGKYDGFISVSYKLGLAKKEGAKLKLSYVVNSPLEVEVRNETANYPNFKITNLDNIKDFGFNMDGDAVSFVEAAEGFVNDGVIESAQFQYQSNGSSLNSKVAVVLECRMNLLSSSPEVLDMLYEEFKPVLETYQDTFYLWYENKPELEVVVGNLGGSN